MYPHSIVSVWADGLDNLSEGNLASTLGASNLSWSGGGSAWGNVVRSAADPRATDQVLVTSFRSAVSQIRNHFVSELGWLVGRHPPD